MKSRWLATAFILLLGTALASVLHLGDTARLSRPEPTRPSEPPFTSLAQVVALEVTSGWVVSAPPREPGPYRRSPESAATLSKGTLDRELTCRVRDEAGTVVEEVRLRSAPDHDQMVVFLDTEGGNGTLVVLRRDR